MLSPKVKCALQILSELEKASRQGTRLSLTDLHQRSGLNRRLVSRTLQLLRSNYWVEFIGAKQVLIKDLAQSTLLELVTDVDEGIYLGSPNPLEGWTEVFLAECTGAGEIDGRLQEEMEKRLSGIFLRDLFPCGGYSRDVRLMRRYERKANGQ